MTTTETSARTGARSLAELAGEGPPGGTVAPPRWYHSGVLRALPRLVLLAGMLTLGSACGDPPKPQDAASLGLPSVDRPAQATQGAPKAFLGAATGEMTITDAKSTPLQAIAGAPLLADDKLSLGEDALVVLVFTNGNVLRLQGPLEQELRGLAGFDSKPVDAGLEAQLALALSDSDRERLGAANERIGGWQLRLKALEAPAPEAEAKAEPEMMPPAPDPAMPDPRVSGGEGPTVGGLPEVDSAGYGNGNGSAVPDDDDPPAEETKPTEPKSKKTQDVGSNNGQASTKEERPPAPGARPIAGPRDEPPADEPAPSEFGGAAEEQDSRTPPLSLAGATWIASQARITVPAELRDELAACLRPIAGTHVIVELALSAGKITSVKVLSSSSKCAEGLKGRSFPGISKSGSVRLIFERD